MNRSKETTKKIKIGFFLLLIFAGLTIFGDEEKRGTKRFQLEIFSGYSFFDPELLNQRPTYDDSREVFRYPRQFIVYKERLGRNYNHTISMDGEFNKIINGFPVGGRIKFSLNKFLAISLGVTYLERTEESRVVGDYQYDAVYTDNVIFYDSQTIHREYSPYTVHLRSISSLLGIHFRVGHDSSLQFEMYAAGGPMFGACDFAYQVKHEQMDYRGYGLEIQDKLTMEGTGTGYNIDIGLRVNIKLFKFLGMFIETGYSAQRVNEISGPGSSEYSRKDTNSEGYTYQNQWNGKWYRTYGLEERDWGSFSYRYPINWNNGGNREEFFLDMSGLRLRMGIYIELF